MLAFPLTVSFPNAHSPLRLYFAWRHSVNGVVASEKLRTQETGRQSALYLISDDEESNPDVDELASLESQGIGVITVPSELIPHTAEVLRHLSSEFDRIASYSCYTPLNVTVEPPDPRDCGDLDDSVLQVLFDGFGNWEHTIDCDYC